MKEPTALKFGPALPYGSARSAAKLASLAEAAGWDGCFLGDAIWCEDPMISLAATAMTTHRIRLGTLIIPMPLRRPWKVASESVALDHLSDGRLILGLGAGAVWMGWQGFPDEVTDPRARAEMVAQRVHETTRQVFLRAEADSVPPGVAADLMAQERIGRIGDVHRSFIAGAGR